jgi:hypothetical protein
MAKSRRSPINGWKPGLYMVDEIPAPFTFDSEAHAPIPPTPGAILEAIEATCFICKKKLRRSRTANAGDYTKEDVFPQWLVEKFELENEYLDFPDGGSAKYPDILVPCCSTCNNKWMSQVERRISEAVKAVDEYPEFVKLSRSDIALWVVKIIYGILMKRIVPWNFRKHESGGSGISEQILDQFRLSLMLLDGFRKRIILNAPKFPISLLVLPISPGATGRLAFDYKDSIEWPTAIAMRMGTVGLIATFEDFGLVNWWYDQKLADLLKGQTLHPKQFMEIAARAFYQAGLGAFNVSYTALTSPRDTYLTLNPIPSQFLPLAPAKERAMIAHMTGDERFLDTKDGGVLMNEDGSFQKIGWPPK